jgi:hypothetical protein
MPMRPDLIAQILAPRIGLSHVADGLRRVIADPVDAERKIGRMYGATFKNREEHYDKTLGRGRMPWTADRGRIG